MKLPAKSYQNLTLLLLAIIVACLLSLFVFQPRAATKANLSDVLLKGPSINEVTKHSPGLMKGLLALLAAFAAVKGRKYWQRVNRHNDVSPEVKKYQEALSAILSLKEKTDPPQLRKRKAICKPKRKPTHLSRKQAKKIIASSRSLSKFKVKQQ